MVWFIVRYIVDKVTVILSSFLKGQVWSQLKRRNLTSESLVILNQLDDFTVSLGAVFPAVIQRSIDTDKGGKDEDLTTDTIRLGWKRNGHEWDSEIPQETSVQVSPSLAVPMQTEDDIFGRNELSRKVLLDTFKNDLIFPLKDSILFAKTDQEAATLLSELNMGPGMVMPTAYNEWLELSSDEAISRMFFHGIGVVLMEEHSNQEFDHFGPFMVDMDLSHLRVREGFRKYGARLHFDIYQRLTAIYDYENRRILLASASIPAEWEHAKHLAKNTALLLITAREHLLWTHLLCANNITRAAIRNLTPNHPLRRLLSVFTFRTNYINNTATMALLPKQCLLHRATSLTYESFGFFMEQAFAECDVFKPFADRPIGAKLKSQSDKGLFPYYSDGIAYFEIVKLFVCEWLQEAGGAASDEKARAFYNEVKDSTTGQKYELPDFETPNAMSNFLTQFIFTVTAYHEVIGTIVDYTQVPSFVGFRVVEGSTQTDLQSFLIAAIITAATAIRTPSLVSLFSNYFGKGGAPEWERAVWSKFLYNLKTQSASVQKANQSRKYAFHLMDPIQFECSVSV